MRLGCVLGLVWLHLYICRQALFTSFSGYANAMHGYWMALASAPFAAWLLPGWWPYADGGMPMEFTYAPLVPWLMRAVSQLAGIPAGQAWHIVAALVYAAGPVTLFWAARRLSGSTAYSFIAAVLYSLWAPTELFVPDGNFAWQHLRDARRFHLIFVWDEAPHLLALALFPPALVCWERVLARGSRRDFAAAILLSAATVLANPFGGAVFALALALLLLMAPWKRAVILRRIGIVAAAAYLLICPWLPPALVAAIVRNSANYELGKWTPGSWAAMAATAALCLVAERALRRAYPGWFARFCLLMSLLLASVLLLHHHRNWHFLPQPGRYRQEFELAFAAALVFGVRPLAGRWPLVVRLALAAALLPLGVQQVIAHRRFSKEIVRQQDVAEFAEAQLAKRLNAGHPGLRVFVPGSAAMWLNAFTPLHQFGGGSFPTALNPAQQAALEFVYGRAPGDGLLWLKSFGAGTLIVSGRNSREFWKPFVDPQRFEGRLPVLWRDADWTAYEVPLPPLPTLSWSGRNRVAVHATLGPGEALPVPINYHPGWSAWLDGRRVPIRKDGMGLMVIEPGRAGPCEVRLGFDGGWEALVARALSLMALASTIALAASGSRG